MEMEDDSGNFNLMDTNEYIIDDWDFDFPLFEENIDHNTKTTINSWNDITETGIFESARERPAKQMKTKNPSPPSSSPLSRLISFEKSNSSPPPGTSNFSSLVDMEQCGSLTEFTRGMSKRKDFPGKREPRLLKEHVLAERNRRQKLNERLIALSALLPGLKKADKATILEDAIKHLKQLQERIKELEKERIPTKNRMESVIFVKKSHVCIEEDSSSASLSYPSLSSDEDSDSQFSSQTLPQIEARVSNNDILIRIHCEKSKGCTTKIMSEIDKLRLDVINSVALPFGYSTLDVTILAKMDESFSTPVKDVVKNIRLAIVD